MGAMAIADLVKTTLGPKGMVSCAVSLAQECCPLAGAWDMLGGVSGASSCERSQDKILQSMGRGQEVVVTNDGATILKSLYVDNPAAKVLVGERSASTLQPLQGARGPCLVATFTVCCALGAASNKLSGAAACTLPDGSPSCVILSC